MLQPGHPKKIPQPLLNTHPPSTISTRPGTLTTNPTNSADGLNSTTKELLLGKKVPPHATGDLAYRLTVREADMRQHAILHDLITGVTNDVWMGPDTFVVGYLLKGGGLYNIVLVHPDKDPHSPNISEAASGNEGAVERLGSAVTSAAERGA